ncbi:unnamed protein product [Ambrosiozyma monospora]|uniref:Unnamed protein product n=1 Tax=Ambrosiozyma monospora TaxID=43982 RepID=A0ACB5TEG9_AMBMO|nr:unnamed protein product [Ambrosiozyma monospora]
MVSHTRTPSNSNLSFSNNPSTSLSSSNNTKSTSTTNGSTITTATPPDSPTVFPTVDSSSSHIGIPPPAPDFKSKSGRSRSNSRKLSISRLFSFGSESNNNSNNNNNSNLNNSTTGTNLKSSLTPQTESVSTPRIEEIEEGHMLELESQLQTPPETNESVSSDYFNQRSKANNTSTYSSNSANNNNNVNTNNNTSNGNTLNAHSGTEQDDPEKTKKLTKIKNLFKFSSTNSEIDEPLSQLPVPSQQHHEDSAELDRILEPLTRQPNQSSSKQVQAPKTQPSKEEFQKDPPNSSNSLMKKFRRMRAPSSPSTHSFPLSGHNTTSHSNSATTPNSNNNSNNNSVNGSHSGILKPTILLDPFSAEGDLSQEQLNPLEDYNVKLKHDYSMNNSTVTLPHANSYEESPEPQPLNKFVIPESSSQLQPPPAFPQSQEAINSHTSVPTYT